MNLEMIDQNYDSDGNSCEFLNKRSEYTSESYNYSKSLETDKEEVLDLQQF